MGVYLRRPFDHRGRICEMTELPIHVRLDDHSMKTLPHGRRKAVFLDIRGTSINELPQGTQFLHIRTDYFVWSPETGTLAMKVEIPESVLLTLRGNRVDKLIEHPILMQLGVHSRYIREIGKKDKTTFCSVSEQRSRSQQTGLSEPHWPMPSRMFSV